MFGEIILTFCLLSSIIFLNSYFHGLLLSNQNNTIVTCCRLASPGSRQWELGVHKVCWESNTCERKSEEAGMSRIRALTSNFQRHFQCSRELHSTSYPTWDEIATVLIGWGTLRKVEADLERVKSWRLSAHQAPHSWQKFLYTRYIWVMHIVIYRSISCAHGAAPPEHRGLSSWEETHNKVNGVSYSPYHFKISLFHYPF